MTGLLDDLPEAALAVALAWLALTLAWRRWRGQAGTEARARPAWLAPVLLLLVGLGVFAMIAEDVALVERDGWVLRLDGRVRAATRPVVATPGVRTAASLATRATGSGLAIAVAAGSAALWASGRRRDAVTLLGGVAGAWALSGLLKLVFAVPRPSASSAVHAYTKYGFPSSHVLVTTVACGLGVWLVGRDTSWVVRLGLVLGAFAIVLLTAASRVILNAHWLSDVVGGALVGAAYVGVTLLVARPRGHDSAH